MIKIKLGAVLADRLITASKVADDTGISRTTLTALKRRNSKGIQFETLNTLCGYLNCEIGENLEYIPD